MLCRVLLSMSLATAGVSAAPAIAAACGNAMFVEDDDAVKQVSEAERLLTLGKLRRAESKVDPHRYRFEASGVQRRADVVWATVAFRSGDADAKSWRVKSALESLQRHLMKDKESPMLLARLAEGQSLAADTRAQALAVLEDLANRDLMPDAFGYRALAQLRAGAGDNEAALAALDACKSMTKRKAVCSLASRKENAKKVEKMQRKQVRARAAVKS